MAQPQKNKTDGIYGSLAYDLDALARERVLEEAGRMEPKRRREAEPIRRPKAAPAVRPRAKVSPLVVASVAVLTGMVVLLLMGYIQLSEISGSVATKKDAVRELEHEHVALLTEYEKTFDLTTLKEAAEEAGMSKPVTGQVEYIELGGPDTAVVYEDGKDGAVHRMWKALHNGIDAVVEYFR